MSLLGTVLKDITTISNGNDFCHSKILSIISFMGFLTLSVWAVIHGDKFDPLAWSGGAGTIIMAGAGGARIKKDTEPE